MWEPGDVGTRLRPDTKERIMDDKYEGKKKQVEGKAQETWGDVKDKAGDAWDDVKDEVDDLRDKDESGEPAERERA